MDYASHISRRMPETKWASSDLVTTSFDTVSPLAYADGAGLPVTAIPIDRSAMTVSDCIAVSFFGTGADNSTFDWKIYGWSLHGLDLVPRLLYQGTCTLSTKTGYSGGTLGTSYRYVDTITVSLGNENVDYEVTSNANNEIAEAIFDIKGHQWVDLRVDLVDATAANALVRPI